MRAVLLLAAAGAAAGARVPPQLLVALNWLAPLLPARDSPAARAAEALPPPQLAGPAAPYALSLAWGALPGATFTLLADDWWDGSQAPPSRVVYTGTAAAATLTDRLLPGAPVSVVLVASDATGAELGRSPSVTFTPADAGACGNAADVAVWRDSVGHLHADVTSCLEDCSVRGDDCTVACVHKADGAFSDACAACWGQYYDCAEAHCTASCGFSPKSAACHTCTEKACNAGAVACTGIPQWAWTR